VTPVLVAHGTVSSAGPAVVEIAVVEIAVVEIAVLVRIVRPPRTGRGHRRGGEAGHGPRPHRDRVPVLRRAVAELKAAGRRVAVAPRAVDAEGVPPTPRRRDHPRT